MYRHLFNQNLQFIALYLFKTFGQVVSWNIERNFLAVDIHILFTFLKQSLNKKMTITIATISKGGIRIYLHKSEKAKASEMYISSWLLYITNKILSIWFLVILNFVWSPLAASHHDPGINCDKHNTQLSLTNHQRLWSIPSLRNPFLSPSLQSLFVDTLVYNYTTFLMWNFQQEVYSIFSSVYFWIT